MYEKLLGRNVLILIIIGATAFGGRALWTAGTKFLNAREQKFDEKIDVLQKQISAIGEEIVKITGENNRFALSLKEIENRQNVRVKSQDELLTETVAKVAPTVVSIVITKNVPDLEVVYQNPFGNDPFFKNFDIKVPVYRQKGTKKQKVGGGSGFLISSNGYILTNKHVVDDPSASYSVLVSDGKQQDAKVIYTDNQKDIAIIKIGGIGYKSATFGNSDDLRLGETVIAIGNALGEYNNSVSVGIISGLNRTVTATNSATGKIETLTEVIQTDAAINPGNSGGPLVNIQGQVIGINVATVVGSSNVSFSIPVKSVKNIVKSVIEI